MLRYKNRVEKLESEMEANRDVVLQRRIMQEKLEKFAELERESISLRSRNQLLVQTQVQGCISPPLLEITCTVSLGCAKES